MIGLDKLEMIELLMTLQTGQRVEMYEPHKEKTFTGTVVKIFRANIPRREEEVKKYFGLCETDRGFRFACSTNRLDYVVIGLDDSDKYYITPRNPKVITRYGLKINKAPKSMIKKCKIPGCENKSSQGLFVGEYCSPCFNLSKYSRAGELFGILTDMLRSRS